MTSPNGRLPPDVRISKSYIFGLSNKPFKKRIPSVPDPWTEIVRSLPFPLTYTLSLHSELTRFTRSVRPALYSNGSRVTAGEANYPDSLLQQPSFKVTAISPRATLPKSPLRRSLVRRLLRSPKRQNTIATLRKRERGARSESRRHRRRPLSPVLAET